MKRDVYASLGVWEYFLFDPPEPRRPARLTGLRLGNGSYHEIPTKVLPDNRRGIPSEVVGLAAHVDDGNLRWFDPLTGVDLLTYDEAEDRREAAELKTRSTARSLEAEAQARHMAEARVAELEARLRERDMP